MEHPLQQLQTLRSALDEVEVGVILLNAQLKMEYANGAFIRMWGLEGAALRKEISFQEIMYLLVTRGGDSPTMEQLAHIELKTALILSGEEDVRDLRAPGQQTLRVRCKVLPDGGRMLVYTNITDLVSHAQKLEKLARTDSLTGLFNRRHFLDVANQEWERWVRYRRPLSLVCFDIDGFKLVNDSFGHEAGDRTLVQVSKIAASQMRGTDILARIGGEEFSLLLPETAVKSAYAVGDRLRQSIADETHLLQRENDRITVSVGAAQADESMSQFADLLRCADRAMYEAKSAGRNRTICAKHQVAA